MNRKTYPRRKQGFFDRLLHTSSGLFVKKGHPDNTTENLGKLRFLAVSALFGTVFIASLLLFTNLPQGNVIGIISDLVLLLIMGFIFYLSKVKGKYIAAYNITVAMLVFILPISFFSDFAERALFLIPVALLFAYFLLGKTGGARWTAVVYVNNGIAVLIDSLGYYEMGFTIWHLASASAAIFFISLMLYTFENNNEINQQLIREQAFQLSQANKAMHTELESREQLTKQLQATLLEVEKNNKVLEDSKRALLNVLEDSNELQIQLGEEKADVEKKIELRTRQLQEEQARLQASIDTLDLGFLMTLKDGKSILHNPALLSICDIDKNISDSELVNKLQELLNSEYDLKAAMEECQITGVPFNVGDIRLNEKYIRVLGSAIKISDEIDSIGVVLLIEDMTEAKMLERSKDEFVSIASHELRTPLTAIRGNLSLMQLMHAEKFTDKDVKQMMDDTIDSVVRLISIVNQFLTTSRLEQKKTVFEVKDVDAVKTTKGVVDDMKNLAAERGLNLELKMQKDLPLVKADEGRLQGILNNIIGNAIKYTEKGKVTVSVKRVGKDVVFTVADTGVGIDEKNQPLLFQKFQQATDNIYTRDDSRSTGLGLYITKMMVEQMGGSIKLDKSVPKKGSTFSFRFPAA